MPSSQDIHTKVEKIVDIPDSEIDKVARDYRASGGDVTMTRQPNGKWTLEARITRASRYQASGLDVL